ncbi:MAG: hypothetical protein HY532_04770 [Chloroflexi bacterium]|nr:hypothetical protein [Chloroflexota bacterium]
MLPATSHWDENGAPCQWSGVIWATPLYHDGKRREARANGSWNILFQR